MRKLKLLLTLLGVFFGLFRSHAEVILSSPVQDGSAITEGYYVIRLNSMLVGNGNYNYLLGRNSRMEWDKMAVNTEDENYVWKFSSNGDGTFSMKHLGTQSYVGIKGSPSGSGSPTITLVNEIENANKVTVEYFGSSTEESNVGEHQYKIITGDNGIVHCEWHNNQSGNVVSWNAGINSASAWCFEKVDETVGDRWDAAFAEAVA